eukprot:TRINITY_DN13_c5_g1_i1.p1 TRINITY_DN13_c5_g1~~TRINITY_DN13_c5_g1_i1.p1  ORF type:complete len:368 (-),score=135.99 TRINITY_DN13_c5_g1_i1:21-1124(-)
MLKMNEPVVEGKELYSYLVPKVTIEQVNQIFNWEPSELELQTIEYLDFNSLLWSTQNLVVLAFKFFENLNLITSLNLNVLTLKKFLISLEKSYYFQNSFHNFKHAFAVALLNYIFLVSFNIGSFFTKAEQVALILASLLHDTDHSGFTNSYHIAVKTSIAVRYQDSPLERHHCHCANEILQFYCSSLFVDLDSQIVQQINSIIQRCILATDMAKHFDIVKQFDILSQSPEFSLSNQEHRIQTIIMLVKTADISNEGRPWPVSRLWADQLLTEFFAQGDYERAHGLKVMPWMDRFIVNQCETQMGFIDTFLYPTVRLMARLFPRFEQLCNNVEMNRATWVKLREEEKQKLEKQQSLEITNSKESECKS